MVKKYPIVVRPNYLSKTKLTIFGEWFNFIDNYGIYLSANKPELNTEVVDLYSEDPKLVVNNPYFFGIPVTNYNVINNNVLEFFLPEDLISAKYDIIICNPAGYSKASTKIYLNVLEVVGIFEFKNFKSISGETINTIENNNLLTIRQSFVLDFAPAHSVTINSENSVFTINGDNIVTIRRFITSD